MGIQGYPADHVFLSGFIIIYIGETNYETILTNTINNNVFYFFTRL